MKLALKYCLLLIISSLAFQYADGQVQTYVNPVIPGDHPDATLTQIGDDYYTSGSSFNVTPKIYHSTDLVHWRVIAQPVAAHWRDYGDAPAGGVWGGHMVLYNDKYWHFFGSGISWGMFFVTADSPEGPWSEPTSIRLPAGLPGFGVDNSIFIDDDNRWFLLTKAGRENNHLVELGADGQPAGEILDLTWLNPEEDGHPYSWAEGPVMWKRDGYYYYSFAQHLAGLQYVMKSVVKDAPLSDHPGAWETPRVLFEGPRGDFATPNHSSPAVTAPDGTSWIISQAYDGSGGNEWQALGRQGLLSQIVYDEDGWPTANYPRETELAPDLPSSGIPWTVPRSDMFDSETLAPDWSFLGRTPLGSHSVTDRPGWLRLTPKGGRTFPFEPGRNTVIQNAAEKAYTLITRVDIQPEDNYDEGGLWIINGPERLYAKAYVGIGATSDRAVTFSFDETSYTVDIDDEGPVWLKLERDGHIVAGSYSIDGIGWTQIGLPIDVSRMDRHQLSEEINHDFNSFTGNQQGPYVVGRVPAYFDLYLYRDAYSPIPGAYPSNYYGVQTGGGVLRGVHDGDWAMYAGVEFGAPNDHSNAMDYPWIPQQVIVSAASAEGGGSIDIWLDAPHTGVKIGSVEIVVTGEWGEFAEFSADIESAAGQRDVYLVFNGESGGELFRIRDIRFAGQHVGTSTAGITRPEKARLDQNFPNPFGAEGTSINFYTPHHARVSLTVFNLLGQQVASLVDAELPAGRHSVVFEGDGLASGVYVYRLKMGDESVSRQMVLRK